MKSNMPASSWKNPIHILAFGFGSGASPKAPGTMGTLVAIPIVVLLSDLPLFAYLAFGVIAFLFLGLFVYLMVVFIKKDKEKTSDEVEQKSKPLFVVILQIIFTIFTISYYILIVLYILFLTKGYLIINFDEFYPGFFLAIQGIYTLFLIVFYTIIYIIILKKKII